MTVGGGYTGSEMMTVAAARALPDGAVVFVGIGLPGAAANLARRLHAPSAVLVYESGCIGAKPRFLPASIGDGVLAEGADAVVGVPEMFSYWLQGGRIDVGLLGAAQIDRFANINTTVIGDYERPRVRLPGAGGAPEIAAGCGEVLVLLRHRRRAFVSELDFITTMGHGRGPGDREKRRAGGQRARRGHHRPRHDAPRRAHRRADPGGSASRCEPGAGAGRHRLAAEDFPRPGRTAAAQSPRAGRAARTASRGMMLEFAYEALPGRVVFGAGARRTVAAEAAALGGRRVMLVADRAAEAAAEEIADGLGRRAAGRFDGVAQHVPADKARAAVAAARELGADTVITVGGGSATGFGKAIALQLDVRLMAVPTTYAGSEMTPIWGLTDGDRKQTGADARVKPEVVVYDPELTLGLPAAVAGPSGMNAVAHAVEATYGPGANPVITLMALEALKALARALPAVVADPDDLAARTEALYGAYLAGVALAAGGNRPAPQGLSRSRRNVRPRPRQDERGDPLPCLGLQRAGGSRASRTRGRSPRGDSGGRARTAAGSRRSSRRSAEPGSHRHARGRARRGSPPAGGRSRGQRAAPHGGGDAPDARRRVLRAQAAPPPVTGTSNRDRHVEP